MAEFISWTDPVGDNTGMVDLVGMDFTFDATGDYTIDLSADEANPFVGDFRININLFNVTLDEFFQDTFMATLLVPPFSVVQLRICPLNPFVSVRILSVLTDVERHPYPNLPALHYWALALLG